MTSKNTAGDRVERRIIICDGAESARLWSRIGTDESEELTWVPREDEARARPAGFKILQGGLDEDAIAKLDIDEDDEFALVSDDGPWTRLAVREIRNVDGDASILVLSDSLTEDDLPDHPSLRRTGWKTLIRDDIDEEFDHLANLQRVVRIRELLAPCERIGILVQPDPDPDRDGYKGDEPQNHNKPEGWPTHARPHVRRFGSHCTLPTLSVAPQNAQGAASRSGA